jgi:anti-sigma28 factor (negative regulator of flagellin synthesis)
MLTLNGIGPVESTGLPRDAKGRDRQNTSLDAARQDGVLISPEAKRAAEAARLVREPGPAAQEVRTEMVEAAKTRIREGSYKLQSVVLQVAARVAPAVEA